MHISPGIFRASAFCSLVVGATLFAGGCASSPQQPYSQRDPEANFSSFRTFAWHEGEDATAPQPLTIVNTQIRDAIATELMRKGYLPVAVGAKPDLLLQYQTDAAEKLKANPVRVSVGVGGYAGGVGMSSAAAKNVREGTLYLRVIDPIRNAEVWNGRVTREVASGGVPSKTLIQGAVADLLREFPAAGVPLQ